MLYLCVEFFKEKNPARLKEYIFAIEKNLSRSFIDKLVLCCSNDEYNADKDFFENHYENFRSKYGDKLVLVKFDGKRFTFNTLFEICKWFPDGTICCTANLDIFLDDSDAWRNVSTEFFEVVGNRACLALCRTEYINDVFEYRIESAWNTGTFCDFWGFRTPLPFKPEELLYTVPVGNAMTCDNKMFYFLSTKYQKVFNWAEKYKIYHIDLVRKPETLVTREAQIISNDASMDMISVNYPLKDIIPYQDWETQLKEFLN